MVDENQYVFSAENRHNDLISALARVPPEYVVLILSRLGEFYCLRCFGVKGACDCDEG